MDTKDFSIMLVVDQSPEEVFNAVCNVRGWWSETIEGGTKKEGDEFRYRHKDLHDSTQRLVDVVPDKKVVWLVTESHISFLQNKSEWNDTRIVFEISKESGKTKLHFRHEGLIPQIECFEACSGGWSYYVKESLQKLITIGKGQPDKKESKQLNSKTI